MRAQALADSCLLSTPPVAAGQPSYEADSESSSQCGGQTQRKHLSDSLWPLCAASGTQSNHWNNCPQTLPLGLEDTAPRNPLRRTRPRSQQSLQAKAYPKNDPTTASPISISHHGMIAISDWHDFNPASNNRDFATYGQVNAVQKLLL